MVLVRHSMALSGMLKDENHGQIIPQDAVIFQMNQRGADGLP